MKVRCFVYAVSLKSISEPTPYAIHVSIDGSTTISSLILLTHTHTLETSAYIRVCALA